jgi:hypothetical protein
VNGNALGNGNAGIVANGTFIAIAPQAPSQGMNAIAFNGSDGIQITDPNASVLIRNNSIHDNGRLGITFHPGSGPTPNDPGDTDSGPNLQQNYPVLSGLSQNGTQVTLTFTLNSTPNTSFLIGVYGNDACDPSGNGEGKYPLDHETAINTDGSGNGSVTGTFTAPAGATAFTAIASNANSPGMSSEFSACLPASGGGKQNQTINFPAPAPQTYSPGGTFGVSATATSGLPVVFATTTPSVCSVNGATVTILAAGTCTITADQPGDANFNPAPQVSQNVAIAKAAQTINFPQPPQQTFVANGTFSVSATASSGLAVTFGTTSPTVCTVAGNTVTMHAAGSCVLTADQAGNGNYNAAPQVVVTVVISLAPPPPPISTAPIPTLSTWSLALLAALLMIAGFVSTRRIRR